MKVFGLGLSRTGTTTLSTVLNDHLGLNHIHYPLKHQLFDDKNDGCSDIPVIPFYKELDAKYPNSKFILTMREKASWMSSIEPYLERKRDWKQSPWTIDMRIKVYGGPFYEENMYSEAYDRHHEDVLSHFSNRPKDLLTINIFDSDDTREIYDFLHVDPHGKPTKFPLTNKLGLGSK